LLKVCLLLQRAPIAFHWHPRAYLQRDARSVSSEQLEIDFLENFAREKQLVVQNHTEQRAVDLQSAF